MVMERNGMRREAHLIENEFVKGEWTDELISTRSSGASGRGLPRREIEQPQGPLLLELQGPGGQRADPPGPAGELGDLGPDGGLGQHPQAERQGGGADVVPALDLRARETAARSSSPN